MLKRVALMAVMSAFVVGSTGCIGSMALSGKVRQFNMDASPDPWPRAGIFMLLYVLPVYPFAGSADLLVINSIEFWTGTNPLSNKKALVTVAQLGDEHREMDADGNIVVSSLRADGSIDVAITAKDGTQSFVNVVNTGEQLVARDAAGNEQARVSLDQY